MGNQPDTTYSPGELQNNTTYFWRINEKNSDGTKVGDIWSFNTENVLSDEAFLIDKSTISISNPANSGRIRVKVESIQEPFIISVISMEGRMLHQTKSSALITEINISEFRKGIYLVRVHNSHAANKALILLE